MGVIYLLFLASSCANKEKSRDLIQIEEQGSFAVGGTVWLNMMGATDTTLHAGFGNVTFEAKARTNWHGVTPDSEFAHIAVSLNIDKGRVVWFGPVTDKDYSNL